jgi:tRNA1Val (adenine37-N6)-methyltransferase
MMDDYSQPDFYRFNQDSTALINWIIQKNLRPHSILDLGAGSGIIGIELARLLNIPELCLVELQEDYLPHLKINVARFLGPETVVDIQITSFSNFKPARYELIVCNPPYYLPGAGQLPVNPQRAKARSFMEDSWEILMKCFKQSLSPKGEGYIVLKNDEGLFKTIEAQAKFNQLQLQKNIQGNLMLIKVSAI